MKPRYDHDCSRCIFLGSTEYKGDHYDLYTCDQAGFGYTVSARWGDEGPDYTSGLEFARHYATERPDHPLAVALRIVQDAVAAGQRPGLPEGMLELEAA